MRAKGRSFRRRAASETRSPLKYAIWAARPPQGQSAGQIRERIAELKKRVERDPPTAGVVWRTPCAADASLIVAGDCVFVGGQDSVTALDAATGKELCKASVEGTARGLAVAAGKPAGQHHDGQGLLLLPRVGSRRVCPRTATADPFPADSWTDVYQRAAEEILEKTGVKRGYCLVVGSEPRTAGHGVGQAQRTEDSRASSRTRTKVQRVCAERCLRPGCTAHRVTVHHADLNAIPYSDYFANLIVSDSLLLTGTIPGDPGELARHLKPAGGVIALGRPANAPGGALPSTTARAWLARMPLAGQSRVGTVGSWVTLTRGMLPGAGNWTHQYAEPGNTACSNDTLVKGDLGSALVRRPGPEMMVNRHLGAVGPLVVNGRMFIQGETSLMAYDAFNGLFLWQIENPAVHSHRRLPEPEPGNLAASDDRVFHMARTKVYEHDAATGEIKRTHELPESVDHEDLRVGLCRRSVTACCSAPRPPGQS